MATVKHTVVGGELSPEQRRGVNRKQGLAPHQRGVGSTTAYTANKVGDRRPGSLGGGHPKKVQRSAAMTRRGMLNRRGTQPLQGSKVIPPATIG